jgi:hypothetical protein
LRSLLWRIQGERLLLRTERPYYQEPGLGVGRIVDHEGRFFRITRRVEEAPIRLERGGSVPQWQIWGRPVSQAELREEERRARSRQTEEPQSEPS